MCNEKKVSVIIPVYNGEKFLEKNLIILTRQTLDDIEFVCVNDASTDGSLNILKAFKEVFPDKFVVVNSEKNRGSGGARNIGLKYARGEYIGFVDQDDYPIVDMYQNLYNEAKRGDYDIVACNFFNKDKGGSYEMERIEGTLDYEKRKEILKIFYVWNKIFRRSLIFDMGMYFRENAINDDTDFTFEAVLRAKSGVIVPDAYYIYNNTQKSTSRTGIIDLTGGYKAIFDLLESMRSRAMSTQNKGEGLKILHGYTLYSIKNALKFLFAKPKLTYCDFLDWHSFAYKVLPDYYIYKDENSLKLEDVIFCELNANTSESFENILKLREAIESGEILRKITQKQNKAGDYSG